MKADLYTKIVLTVIAVNLSILTVKNLELIPKSYAHEVSGKKEILPKTTFGLVPLNEDGSINVRLNSSEQIDVNITDISTSDKLNVHLKSSDAYSLKFAGPIKVEME